MREKLKKIVAYIFRSWENEPTPPFHPILKILPPFIWNLIDYSIIYQIGAFLWKHI